MIHVGDCLSILPTLAANSADAIVTDPPYGLSFMGKRWDYDVPSTAIWAECLRVLKPGGHLLAFAGTRTQHRMAVRIEDAGFDIRDMIAWVYGSGFPKSHNGEWGGTGLKPALEPITLARKPLIGTVAANHLLYGTGALNTDCCGVGAKFSDGGRWPANLVHDGSEEVLAAFPDAPGQQGDLRGHSRDRKSRGIYGDMAAARDALSRGDSGSAARFFHKATYSQEELVTIREGSYDGACLSQNLPLSSASTAEKNSSPSSEHVDSVLDHAVLRVLPEGLRCSARWTAPFTSDTPSELSLVAESVTQAIQSIGARFWHESQHARLSLTFSHVSVAATREPTGITTITASLLKSGGSAVHATFSITPLKSERGAKGSRPATADRFIYCAKASRKDRGEGNTHPTVKPTDLMRYLCRLVTPAGGTVLDPFMGSGSTGKAAALEGFAFVGIEMDPVYAAIAEARIAAAIEAAAREAALPTQIGLPLGEVA